MITLLAEVAAESAPGANAEEVVLRLLIQIMLILAVTRLLTMLVRRLGQTDVTGEILAGLILGPSCLAALAPVTMHRIFDASAAPVFSGIAQVGLVLLLFQIGLEFEFHANLAGGKKGILAIGFAGLALPFALGFLAAPWFWQHLEDPRPLLLGFRLFFAIAMSITAIPVLGRIFMDLGLTHTRTAALTIGAAALNDVVGWMLLGVVSLVVAGKFSFAWPAGRAAALAVYVAFVFFVARPPLKRWVSRHLEKYGELRMPAISVLLLILFASAAVTSYLGVFAIIGGFIIGVALHDDRRFVAAWKTQMSPLVTTFFLPLFFAYTGLRTDIGSLHGLGGILICSLVIAIAFAGKFLGAFAAAFAVGEPPRSAFAIGIAMNTRGMMELIVLNVGYDMGVLPKSMFTMLVLMAMVSTFIATPLIRWSMKGQEKLGKVPALPDEGPATAGI